MEKKEYKLTDTLLDLKAELFVKTEEKSDFIEKLLHKKSVKKQIELEKSRQKFWTEVYKLYPELRSTSARIERFKDEIYIN